MSYFIITGDPIHIEGPLTWEQVEKRILPDPDNEDHTPARDGFYSEVPQQDRGYFELFKGKRINHDREHKVLIIKGDIVVPKPRATVTKFDEPGRDD